MIDQQLLKRNGFWIFLSGSTLAGMVFIALVTSRYGSGVSSDAVKYLSAADSLVHGRGYQLYNGGALYFFPPLYSLVLALGGLMTGLDVLVVGRYLHILLFGLDIVFTALLLRKVFPEEPYFQAAGVLFVVFSVPSIRLYANIASDPLFYVMALGFAWIAISYLEKKRAAAFWGMLVIAGLAGLLRYVGLSLGVTGCAVLVYAHWKDFRVMVVKGLVFGLFSIAPLLAWMLLYNLGVHGAFWGSIEHKVFLPWVNVQWGLAKMLHWFIPYYQPLRFLFDRPFILAAGLLLLLGLFNRRSHWLAWLRRLSGKPAYPVMVFGLVYFTALAVTASTLDHKGLESDRYYPGLIVTVLVLVFAGLRELVFPHFGAASGKIRLAILVLFLVWLSYPVFSFYKYARAALVEGEPSISNYYNNRKYAEMPLMEQAARMLESEPGAVFYSNYPDALWFHLRADVDGAPRYAVSNPPEGALDRVLEQIAGWPGDRPGYLVWFTPNIYNHVLPPEDLARVADMQLVYEEDSGQIWEVRPR